MARIRTIKPEFFRHESLYEAEQKFSLPLRIAFAGLWICCDREGRFRWKAKQLKLDILPFDEIDFAEVLSALESINMIIKYENNGEIYGYIPTWKKHQVINIREAKSIIPDPENIETHVHAHAEQGEEPYKTCGEGKGKRKGREKEGKNYVCTETKKISSSAPPDPADVVMTFPVDGQHAHFHVLKNDVEKWQKFYPSLDVQSELLKMAAWLDANAERRKTKGGMPRFVVNWLNREQDSSKGAGGANGKQRSGFENEVERALRLIDEAEASQK